MKQKLLNLLSSSASTNARTKAHMQAVAMIKMYAEADAFTKVRKAIEKQIATLKAEKADDVDHRDYCVAEFAKNKNLFEAEEDKNEGLVSQRNELAETLKKATEDVKEYKDEIAQMQLSSNRAADDRARENAEFQAELQDQLITETILRKALARLTQKYALLQAQADDDDAELALAQQPAHMNLSGNAPARFSDNGAVKLSGAGAKVTALIEEVIKKGEATMRGLKKAEKDSQVAYESFVQGNNKSIAEKQQAVIAKPEEIGMSGQDFANTKRKVEESDDTIAGHKKRKDILKGSCDFIMANFDIKQQALSHEMEALRQATSVLSGEK